ncbi:PH domain-containing protein [Streptomyces axinellae]|uniref:YdbS-like PH domain-containing protein n=1 Tax=Streptomyces axinellae TaxID=552788 RepID=A0ABP6CBB0_9ACTN
MTRGTPPDADGRQGDGGRGNGGQGDGGQGEGSGGPDAGWRGVERALLSLRRLVLVSVLLPLAVVLGVVPVFTVGPAWALFALVPLVVAVWGWGALARNWRSWRYTERAGGTSRTESGGDLLISRGVLWQETTVVPYGRMQLVEVTSGPLERRYGLATLQLHTAAATTDASIPGLSPAEAERLRDRLTELGEARSAGL